MAKKDPFEQLGAIEEHTNGDPFSSLGAVPDEQESFMTDVSDAARGLGSGITMGGLDELLGAAKAAKEVAVTDKTLQDLPSLYRKYQEIEEAKNKQAEERSPYLYGGADIAGSIATGLATGGAGLAAAGGKVALKEALKQGGKAAVGREIAKRAAVSAATAAPIGAITGALGSKEGALIGATPEQEKQLLKDTAIGALTGGILGGSLSTAGDAVSSSRSAIVKKASTLEDKLPDIVQDNPFLRQLKTSYKEGKLGKGFVGEKATKELLEQETGVAQDLTNKILEGRDELGKNIGKVLSNSDELQKTIQINTNLSSSASDLQNMLNQRKGLLGSLETQNANEIIEKLKSGNLSPSEAHKFKNDIKQLANNLDDYELKNVAKTFQKEMDVALRNQVDGYKDALKQYHEYNKSTAESIISKGIPIEQAQTFISDKSKPAKELFSSIENVMGRLTAPGTSGDQQKKAFYEFMDNLKTFEKDYPEVMEKLGLSSNKIANQITKQADLTSVRKSIQGFNPESGAVKSVLGGFTPRGITLRVANIAGQANKSLQDVSKNLYSASNESLKPYIELLNKTPGVQNLGKGLEDAITNNDSIKRNAALFAILQNPKARMLLNSGEFEENNNE